MKTSARNQLAGKISRVEHVAVNDDINLKFTTPLPQYYCGRCTWVW